MTSTTVKCRACGRLRAPAEVLVIRDRIIGDTFHVCRPDQDRGPCFRSVGSADRFAIAPAVDSPSLEVPQ